MPDFGSRRMRTSMRGRWLRKLHQIGSAALSAKIAEPRISFGLHHADINKAPSS
jgi:hypothetical protein